MPDPYEKLSRPRFERMVAEATAELTDEDWEGLRQSLIIDWEKQGIAAWIIEPLRRCDPKTSPIIRRKAFELATSEVTA